VQIVKFKIKGKKNMPRKKSAAALAAEEVPPKKTVKKIVPAKTVVTYETEQIVEVPAESEDIDSDVFFDDEIEETEKYRPPTLSARLKEKFIKRGIGGSDQLHLRIDRMPLYEVNGVAGIKSDKEFCGVIQCTEEFFDNDIYLGELLKRYGPGEYWLTLRHKATIIKAWRERIGGFPVPIHMPAADASATPPPGYPPAYYPYGNPPPPPPSVREMFSDQKALLKDQLEMAKLIRESYGIGPGEAPKTEDDALASAIFKRPEILDTVIGSVMDRYANGKGSEPTFMSWLMLATQNGQLAQTAGAVIQTLMSGLQGIIGKPPQPIAQNGETPAQIQAPPQQPQSPEEFYMSTILAHVVTGCAQILSPEDVAQDVFDYIYEEVGTLHRARVEDTLRQYAELPPDAVIAYLESLPNGAQVVAMDHTREWIELLQKAIKTSEASEDETNESESAPEPATETPEAPEVKTRSRAKRTTP
jgi:hypothetical protein